MSARKKRRHYKAGEAARLRHSWLELVQQSGPFLSLPVVDRVFPDGLPAVPASERATVRAAVAQMLADDGASRRSVIELILAGALDWRDHLRRGHELPDVLAEPVPDYGVMMRPDFGFYSAEPESYADDEPEDEAEGESEDDDDDIAPAPEAGPWRALGVVSPWGAHPLTRTTESGWTASPVERLAHLLRARDQPIGIVTDGRWWALVWAPIGGATGVAVWDASVWSEEPESLQAFIALLTRARFQAATLPDRLPALFLESVAAQEEVTDTLGVQVRDAVELLLSTVDRLDADSGGRLLAGVSDDELYDGVVTVLMRIVFLLFAEERRLLPSDDSIYAAAYSVGRLVDQLVEQESVAGEQTLEYRTGAWHRLLATSQAVHRGIAHEDLRLPAYGGGLFDPDRFPWLEGRTPGLDDSDAVPPAVDDRTVLRLLRAVQYVTIDGAARKLTFRALDVEQIGYVYEGLLELEVRTADEVMLCLHRPPKWPKAKHDAEVTLAMTQEMLGTPQVLPIAEWVSKRTGWSATALAKIFEKPLERERRAGLFRATDGDTDLVAAIEPYAGLLRYDELGQPAVVLPGRRFVAPSTRRASTGTHYTPRSLAEDVVHNTLEPLVYRPGPLETADRTTWQIRPSSELLDLTVADIAMGSGAFLVAACRYLADRVVNAWVAEGTGSAVSAAQRAARGALAGDADVDRVALDARRLVAEHCLYGVDINPLAVEMAKLSLWLVTMDRERAFGFLDDRLLCGDALLGLSAVEQLETLHVDPVAGRRLHHNAIDYATPWRPVLAQVADLRRKITASPVNGIRDVEHKQRLLTEANALSTSLHTVADAITGTGLRAAKVKGKKCDAAFVELQFLLPSADDDNTAVLSEYADQSVQAGRPPGVVPRRPLHWPLAFPEVFVDADVTGFDAIVGNPPFSGGQKLSATLGADYLAWLQRWDGRDVKGSADLVARFVLRAERLLSPRGQVGYIATNTLVQGATLRVGLQQVVGRGLTVRRGRSSHQWPSASANLEIVDVWGSRAPLGPGAARWLDGEEVPLIGADLEPVGRVAGRPFHLAENDDIAFQGSNVLGLGFTVTYEQAGELIARDSRNAEALQPYVIGKDLNQRPDCSASRWIINFRDWPLEEAENYPDLIRLVRRLVKPERDSNNRANYRECWWRYGEHRPGLYAAIADLDHVLALSRVGNAIVPVRATTGPVFSEATVVFALDDFASLAFLSSSVHTTWVVRYTSTLETRIRYAPSDVFRTLPRPESTPEMENLGQRLDEERRELMLSRSWELTTTYNHVHSPADRDPAVQQLRELHADIDRAVLAAYGWDDLDLGIGHHPTKIGIRWTVSKDARFELLARLLEENHRRHEQEQQ